MIVKAVTHGVAQNRVTAVKLIAGFKSQLLKPIVFDCTPVNAEGGLLFILAPCLSVFEQPRLPPCDLVLLSVIHLCVPLGGIIPPRLISADYRILFTRVM